MEIKARLLAVLALVSRLPVSTGKANCPLYGPIFPEPTNLLSNTVIQTAGAALDGVFAKYIDNDNSTGSDRFSYSVEVFSGSEDKPLWSHYWTAPNLKTLNTTGVTTVDTNTVYRIGSITKIFTMLTFLAAVGDGIWNDPITKHLPEIAEIASKASGGPIFAPDWDSITIGSLASQTSGLIRDYSLLGELSYEVNLTTLYTLGFPPLNMSEFPPCGTVPTCDRGQLFAGIAKLPPSFPPFTTPTYSDIGFVLLSFVAEKITGKNFSTLVQDTVLSPLNLTRTFLSAPNDSVGIIPGTVRSTTWGFQLGEESATGNMYTSAGDLSSLGRAILKSTLLKPAMTRRWLRPVSYSSDPKAMVGMPWGVRRMDLGENQTYQSLHTFNKAGSLGAYSTLLALIPSLDLGFTVLAAAGPDMSVPPTLTMDIADALASTYIPSLTYLARAQAADRFAGVYKHASLLANTTDGRTEVLNSSLTVTVDLSSGSKPGLGVEDWLSNGTYMAPVAVAIGGNVSREYLESGKLQASVRLYPTGLEESVDLSGGEGKGKRVAFKAVFEDVGLPAASNQSWYLSDCSTWVGVTGVVYGSRPLDLFVFEVGEDGKARAVVNEALRVRLERVGS